EEFVAVPARGQRPGFGFAVADDAGDDEIGIIESRSVGVGKGVAKLAAFMNGAGRLRRHVAGDAPRERELSEEAFEAFFILTDVRVDLAVGAFEVNVGHDAWPAVPGAA